MKRIRALGLCAILMSTYPIQTHCGATHSYTRITTTAIGALGSVVGGTLIASGAIAAAVSNVAKKIFQQELLNASKNQVSFFGDREYISYLDGLRLKIELVDGIYEAVPFIIVGGVIIAIPSLILLANMNNQNQHNDACVYDYYKRYSPE